MVHIMTNKQIQAITDAPNGSSRLNVRLPNVILRRLADEAKLEQRTLSATTKRLLVEALDTRNRKRTRKEKIPWNMYDLS